MVPFLCGSLPYLARESAGDEVPLFGGDHTHASLLRDAPGGGISCCLRNAQHGEAKNIEPVVIHSDDSLRHQALAVPRQAQPESAIVRLAFVQRD
jgi:hypothetical protein